MSSNLIGHALEEDGGGGDLPGRREEAVTEMAAIR